MSPKAESVLQKQKLWKPSSLNSMSTFLIWLTDKVHNLSGCQFPRLLNVDKIVSVSLSCCEFMYANTVLAHSELSISVTCYIIGGRVERIESPMS